METNESEKYYALDKASMVFVLLSFIGACIVSIEQLFLMLFVTGGLILSRYLYSIYVSNASIKKLLFLLTIIIYILGSISDSSYFILFTIYFLASAVERNKDFTRLKVTLLFLLPETLLLMKYLIHNEISFTKNWQASSLVTNNITLLLVAILIALFSTAYLLIDKAINTYEQANTRLNEALERSAVNELIGKRLNKELAIKNILADRTARLEEREKISRDIHNSVGHTITSAIMALDAAEIIYDIDPKKAKEKFIIANSRMHDSFSSIRKAVRILDEEEITMSIGDLLSSLIECAKQFEHDTKVKLRHNLSLIDKVYINHLIDKDHANFLYGALQESFSNGVRHGKATAFILLGSIDTKHIKLTIQDNGIGFKNLDNEQIEMKLKKGFGIKKINDYISNVGGDLKYNGEDGFTISITLPLKRTDGGFNE